MGRYGVGFRSDAQVFSGRPGTGAAPASSSSSAPLYTSPPMSSAPGGAQDSASAAVDPASVPVGNDEIDGE